MLKKEVEKLKAMSREEFAKLYYGRQFRVDGHLMYLQGYTIEQDRYIMGWPEGWGESALASDDVLLGKHKCGKYWYVSRRFIDELLAAKGHIVKSKYKPCEE